MSLTFNCPSCRAQMEVADELAGQTGQCPRCKEVFPIPSPKAPMAVPTARPVGAKPTKIPPLDPWGKEPPRDEDAPRSRTGDRPRRNRPAPQPSGPVWPWLVGIGGVLAVGGLLFASFLVLVSYRKPISNDPRHQIKQQQAQIALFNNQLTTMGRLEGQQAFMQDGIFQVKADLNTNDGADRNNPACRVKRYDIQLIANQTYVIEMDSNAFDCRVRLERMNQVMDERGFFGNRNAQILFRSFDTQIYTVYATSAVPANGPFTLTVREQHRMKPFIP